MSNKAATEVTSRNNKTLNLTPLNYAIAHGLPFRLKHVLFCFVAAKGVHITISAYIGLFFIECKSFLIWFFNSMPTTSEKQTLKY